MTWREHANCAGADETFVPDHTDANQMKPLAQLFCHGCPALQDCGAFADRNRHAGLWGGVFRHRAAESGRYRWHVLVDGAPEPQLSDRRSGAHVGWVA